MFSTSCLFNLLNSSHFCRHSEISDLAIGSPAVRSLAFPMTREEDAKRQAWIANAQIVADYLARLDNDSFPDRVRARLVEVLPSGEVEAELLARGLNLSLRTLQRRLAKAGTSYSELLDEARRELALRYIGEHRLSIKETTYVLGFSEPANFTRAFRRWTGFSPTQYRQQVNK